MQYYDKAIRLDSGRTARGGCGRWLMRPQWRWNEFKGAAVNPCLWCGAISGLFRSIDLGSEEPNVTVLQDILRLLKLWSKSGKPIPPFPTRSNGTSSIPPAAHLAGASAVPTHGASTSTASSSDQRSVAAQKIMQAFAGAASVLVEEARLIARELIRVAVLWSEMWLKGWRRPVISKQNVDTKALELRHFPTQLLHASGLQLAVPGCYGLQGSELVRIEGFSPTLRVIRSKHAPESFTIMAATDWTTCFCSRDMRIFDGRACDATAGTGQQFVGWGWGNASRRCGDSKVWQ
ncbi:hypothetical protein BASA81_015432 [Batrachochytrium salamandrivorans]|nr:hypothetical protein BASA81_015432 [Batrachochytrium salamandrivorans]